MPNDPRRAIVEALRATGLTQRALGLRIGVSQPSVRDWLIGATLPDAQSVRLIVAAFPQTLPLARVWWRNLAGEAGK